MVLDRGKGPHGIAGHATVPRGADEIEGGFLGLRSRAAGIEVGCRGEGDRRRRGSRLTPQHAVLDIIGNSTVLDSLAMARRGGRVCVVGLLDHVESVGNFNPIFQMPHVGVHFSSFVSWSFGTPECLLSDIPFQTIIDRVASGAYKAKPAKVLGFEDIQEAHRLLETNEVGGKIVVRL